MKTQSVRFASYRRREATISAAINMAFSGMFYLAVFGTAERLPMRGVGNFAFDFLPQSIAIGLMASLVPGLLMRGNLRKDRFSDVRGAIGMAAIGYSAMRCVFVAAGAGITLLSLFWFAAPDEIGRSAALVVKLAYGAVLGSITTYLALPAILERAEIERVSPA